MCFIKSWVTWGTAFYLEDERKDVLNELAECLAEQYPQYGCGVRYLRTLTGQVARPIKDPPKLDFLLAGSNCPLQRGHIVLPHPEPHSVHRLNVTFHRYHWIWSLGAGNPWRKEKDGNSLLYCHMCASCWIEPCKVSLPIVFTFIWVWFHFHFKAFASKSSVLNFSLVILSTRCQLTCSNAGCWMPLNRWGVGCTASSDQHSSTLINIHLGSWCAHRCALTWALETTSGELMEILKESDCSLARWGLSIEFVELKIRSIMFSLICSTLNSTESEIFWSSWRQWPTCSRFRRLLARSNHLARSWGLCLPMPGPMSFARLGSSTSLRMQRLGDTQAWCKHEPICLAWSGRTTIRSWRLWIWNLQLHQALRSNSTLFAMWMDTTRAWWFKGS